MYTENITDLLKRVAADGHVDEHVEAEAEDILRGVIRWAVHEARAEVVYFLEGCGAIDDSEIAERIL